MNALLFAVLCLIWGTTWMAIKVNLTSFPPFYSAGMRFLLAGFVLFGVMKLKGASFPKDKSVLNPSIVFGLLNGVSYGLVYWGEQYIPSGLTAVLNASLPLFSIIFARLFIGETITGQKIIGSVIGFSGVVLLFYESLSGMATAKLAGEIGIVVASCVYAFAGVHVKKRSVAQPIVAVTIQMFTSAAVLLLLAIPIERYPAINFTWTAFAAFLYLSMFGSAIAFYIYNALILRIEVTKLSYTSLITPAVATLVGVLMLGEQLNLQMITGMLLILGGTAIVNIQFRKTNTSTEVKR